MREWATSGEVKIGRADEHIRYLETEIAAFRERHPYFVFSEPGPDGWHGTNFVIHAAEDIPEQWSAVAADAIHNLHVALDYLWQRATLGSKSQRRNQFPAHPNPKSVKARPKRKDKTRAEAAMDLLDELGAFNEGNPFWTIRCFDNADKHDTIALVACHLKEVTMDLFKMVNGVSDASTDLFRITVPHDEFRVIEDGAILYSLAGDPPKVDVKHEVEFEIAFGDSEILKREPVLPTLQNLSLAVGTLATAFQFRGFLGTFEAF